LLSEQGHRRHRHATPSRLGENLLDINRTSDERLGIADGDCVKVIGAHSTITAQAKLGRRELKYGVVERRLFFAEATHTVARYYRGEASSSVRQLR
jgi:anaerobic selenocysteine-containing dehydrogenase